jgi:hypothetical protein
MKNKELVVYIKASIKWLGNSGSWTKEQGMVFDRIAKDIESNNLYFVDLKTFLKK